MHQEARFRVIGASAAGIATKSRATSLAAWFVGSVLVTAFGVALAVYSPRFGYAYDLGEMPIIWLTAGLVLAGLVYFFGLPPLIVESLSCDRQEVRQIMICIVAAGLVARLVLFASEPILEDDYQRYLWDGAVTASGHNPYAMSPYEARKEGGALAELAREGEQVASRINHSSLKTVYPPVTQGAFALAYLIKPWSLTAWRSVLLIFDVVTLTLVLLLLREAGRSPLWSALYWWNPIVIKELFNSAHMDAVVVVFTLLALWLGLRRRPIASLSSLGLAIGAKLWPVLLLPVLLRRYAQIDRRLTAGAIVVLGVIVTLWAIPILSAGLDDRSGFVTYFSSWQTGSALSPALEQLVGMVFGWMALPADWAGFAARSLLALCLAIVAFAVSVKPVADADDFLGRASLVVAALVLLSPAQFPWYAVWFAPFLAFRPWTGFLLLTATFPLYYLDFYFIGRDQPEMFATWIVWIIWLPVWGALAVEAARKSNRRLAG